MNQRIPAFAASALVLALAACAGQASDPVSVGMGVNPQLDKPQSPLIPTVKTAKPVGWAGGETPVAAPGLKVEAFATAFDHPRWLHVMPNGDVLVAETNAPERPDENKGIKGFFAGIIMGGAGASVPSPNRITLLRDTDGDGKADLKTTFIDGLYSPFGMAIAGGKLFIANTDGVVAVPYSDGLTKITAKPVKFAGLPGGALNHHWTKSLIASKDGSRLYATVGSNSNVGENGLDKEIGRAAIWEIDAATGDKRLFATGLRNPNGLAWEPVTGALWTAVNERDELGHNLVPDYITSVKDGAHYGWPWSYYGQTVDKRVKPANPDMVAKAIAPDYAVGAHTASLGLAFADGALLGPAFGEGAFVGQHGSWNRNPVSGYKVIFVPFTGGKPSAEAKDVLTGFLNDKGQARGRPVGVAIAKDGALLVADDVGNVVWRVTAATRSDAAVTPR